MVDVSHDCDDGRTGNEAFDFFNRICLLFGENFLRRLFGLIFKLYAHARGEKRSGIIIDAFVYRLHYALFEEALRNFDGGDAELFRQHL